VNRRSITIRLHSTFSWSQMVKNLSISFVTSMPTSQRLSGKEICGPPATDRRINIFMTEREREREREEKIDLMKELRRLNEQNRCLVREQARITKEFARINQRLKELRKQKHPGPNCEIRQLTCYPLHSHPLDT